MVLGFRQRLSDHRHQSEVCNAYPRKWALNGQRNGFPFDGTKFAWALSCQYTKASRKGARPMLDPNRRSETSSPAASGILDLEALVIWLRGLSAAEFEELSEAIANQDAESLSRFDTRFRTHLGRSA